jgi:acyl-Coa thioesterase superfamily protein/acyl-CoA thioesterase superfamily protein
VDELSAFFHVSEYGFEPLPLASSTWSSRNMNGPAVCAILARALENDYGIERFVPSRFTVDLFSPARFETLTVATSEVRAGNRIRVADATAIQAGKAVARASAVFLKTSGQPPGDRWTRDTEPVPPTPELVAATVEVSAKKLWHSDNQEQWSSISSEHQNAARKRVWSRPIGTVLGERPSQFVRAAIASEMTNMMTNWGTEGLGFINADLTLGLARLPIGEEIGVEADNHVAVDGIAVGTATLFDRHGVFGTGMVTAIGNAERQISLEDGKWVVNRRAPKTAKLVDGQCDQTSVGPLPAGARSTPGCRVSLG